MMGAQLLIYSLEGVVDKVRVLQVAVGGMGLRELDVLDANLEGVYARVEGLSVVIELLLLVNEVSDPGEATKQKRGTTPAPGSSHGKFRGA
jgi:hypothetical protein